MKTWMTVAALMLLSATAQAGPDGDEPCSHPNFVTHECLASLDIGGADGQDGADGTDGADGADGRDGRDGIDGRDGRDGVVPNDWYRSMTEYMAATSAAQVYLPQDKDDRITVGMSRVAGRTGYGLGYARVLNDDNRLAITLSIGKAGDESTGNASVGWEF